MKKVDLFKVLTVVWLLVLTVNMILLAVRVGL